VNLQYRRTGGRDPSLDEKLQIDDDGFQLLRQVAVDRVGTFAGSLDPVRRDQLAAALASVGPAIEIEPTHPGTVLELVDWPGGHASFPLYEDLPDEWERVRELLDGLIDELKNQPVAALQAQITDAGDTVVLESVGSAAADAGLDNCVLRLTLFDEEDLDVGAVSIPLPTDPPIPTPLPAKWRFEVPIAHGLDFIPQRTLRLNLNLQVNGQEGELIVFAGKGWNSWD
jgi:hypothetical protein